MFNFVPDTLHLIVYVNAYNWKKYWFFTDNVQQYKNNKTLYYQNNKTVIHYNINNEFNDLKIIDIWSNLQTFKQNSSYQNWYIHFEYMYNWENIIISWDKKNLLNMNLKNWYTLDNYKFIWNDNEKFFELTNNLQLINKLLNKETSLNNWSFINWIKELKKWSIYKIWDKICLYLWKVPSYTNLSWILLKKNYNLSKIPKHYWKIYKIEDFYSVLKNYSDLEINNNLKTYDKNNTIISAIESYFSRRDLVDYHNKFWWFYLNFNKNVLSIFDNSSKMPLFCCDHLFIQLNDVDDDNEYVFNQIASWNLFYVPKVFLKSPIEVLSYKHNFFEKNSLNDYMLRLSEKLKYENNIINIIEDVNNIDVYKNIFSENWYLFMMLFLFWYKNLKNV